MLTIELYDHLINSFIGLVNISSIYLRMFQQTPSGLGMIIFHKREVEVFSVIGGGETRT